MNGTTGSISCPGCDRKLELQEIESLTTTHAYKIFCKQVRIQEVARNADMAWCPRPGCNAAVVRNSKDEDEVVCKICELEFCFSCQADHDGLSCTQYQKKAAKEMASDKEYRVFRRWRHKNRTRTCPNCNVVIHKLEDGSCNHMVCMLCATEFCWICREIIPPEGHFDPGNIMGCPGLQYKTGKVGKTQRAVARGKVAAKVGGRVVGGVIVLPFVAIACVPIAMYRAGKIAHSKYGNNKTQTQPTWLYIEKGTIVVEDTS
eukprot:Clim_evm12s172 gene=Clim_evmTU12s172